MQKQRHPSANRNGHGNEPRPLVSLDESIDQTSDPQDSAGNEGLAQFWRQIRELGEYVSYYLAAQADGAKLGLRNALINTALGAFAFFVLACLSVGAIWFGLNGMSEGLGLLCGNRPWAGNLLTGLLLAVSLAGGIGVVLNRVKKLSCKETVAHYENRQFRQQARYGHNVAERAATDSAQNK